MQQGKVGGEEMNWLRGWTETETDRDRERQRQRENSCAQTETERALMQ